MADAAFKSGSTLSWPCCWSDHASSLQTSAPRQQTRAGASLLGRGARRRPDTQLAQGLPPTPQHTPRHGLKGGHTSKFLTKRRKACKNRPLKVWTAPWRSREHERLVLTGGSFRSHPPNQEASFPLCHGGVPRPCHSVPNCSPSPAPNPGPLFRTSPTRQALFPDAHPPPGPRALRSVCTPAHKPDLLFQCHAALSEAPLRPTAPHARAARQHTAHTPPAARESWSVPLCSLEPFTLPGTQKTTGP